MDFTAIKYSGQGSFKVKKGTIDKLFFFTENDRHLPIPSVNDPLHFFLNTYLHTLIKFIYSCVQIFYLRLQPFCFYFIVQVVQFTLEALLFYEFYVVQSSYNVLFGKKTCVLHVSFIIIPFVIVVRYVF